MGDDMVSLRMNDDNFGFAFNDKDFSDRILLIKIMPDDSLGSNTNKYSKWLSSVNAAQNSNELENCDGVKVKTLHISSPVLAAKSLFFYKLFKNGMRESQSGDVTLIVTVSEEAALMEVLYFIYHRTLNVTSSPDLLDVLMAADKFEVTSCMAYCMQMLMKLSMTLDSALSYIELPSSILVAEIVKPLLDSAKQFLALHMDFSKFQQEAMGLSLSAIEVVLSGYLQVDSEDDIFDFILKWARAHYMNLEERREILFKHLAKFINFPNMSCSKLNEVVACPDFDGEQMSKLVLKSLIPKVGSLTTTECGFQKRVYSHGRIKVGHLGHPWPHCVVYFDLTKDECVSLYTWKIITSQAFLLDGRWFFLKAMCTSEHRFGLFVEMMEGSKPCNVTFELSAMVKSSMEFENKRKDDNHNFVPGQDWGFKDFFQMSWNDFVSDGCKYFINDMLQLRAEININS